MKRWVLLSMCCAWVSTPALGDEFALQSRLHSPPSDRPWINVADCADEQSRGDLLLRAVWSAYTDTPKWTNEENADVFISENSTCGSVKFEIGESKDGGGDLKVEYSDNFEYQYPERDTEKYTLTDLLEDSNLSCDAEVEDNYHFCIKWESTSDNITHTYYGAAPLRIDFKAPSEPTLLRVDPGDKNLKVYWESPDDEDIDGFYVYYRKRGEGDDSWSRKDETDENATSAQITNLENMTAYEVEVSAYDWTKNEGFASDPGEGTPVPVMDFYEYYRDNGGAEQGGYCFVATAAYGSYADAMVMPLRRFRDRVLMRSELGRDFVAAYYRYGPRWARAVRHSAGHRAVARWSLVPLVGLAGLSDAGPEVWLALVAALTLLVFLVVRFRRWLARLVRRAGPAMLVALALLAPLLSAPVAEAAAAGHQTALAASEPQFQLQLRLGSYHPAVDSEEFDGDAKPFRDIFGASSQLLFEVGLDYEIWRGFGAIAAGGSIGFVQYLGRGRFENGGVSSDTTVFNLLPLRLNLGYHLTLLDELWQIPFVPYVQGGLSYYFWWVTDGIGDIAEWQDPDSGETQRAAGGIFGWHVGAGIKLLLDFLDPQAAASLENDVGVVNTFLFAEYTLCRVDGFGSDERLNVGDDTFMFGLMMEF